MEPQKVLEQVFRSFGGSPEQVPASPVHLGPGDLWLHWSLTDTNRACLRITSCRHDNGDPYCVYSFTACNPSAPETRRMVLVAAENFHTRAGKLLSCGSVAELQQALEASLAVTRRINEVATASHVRLHVRRRPKVVLQQVAASA